MAQTVKIISDSTCDLSKDLLEKYDIAILPLHILLGETEYRDGVDITPEEIFRGRPGPQIAGLDTGAGELLHALDDGDLVEGALF